MAGGLNIFKTCTVSYTIVTQELQFPYDKMNSRFPKQTKMFLLAACQLNQTLCSHWHCSSFFPISAFRQLGVCGKWKKDGHPFKGH